MKSVDRVVTLRTEIATPEEYEQFLRQHQEYRDRDANSHLGAVEKERVQPVTIRHHGANHHFSGKGQS